MTDLDLDGFAPIGKLRNNRNTELRVFTTNVRLSAGAKDAIGNPRRVQLLINEQARQVLLRPAAGHEEGTYANSDGQINCAALLKLLRTPGDAVKTYPLTVTDHGLLLTYSESEGK